MQCSKAVKFINSIFLLIALILLNFQPLAVLADGFIIRPNPNQSQWQYGSEQSQIAYIDYKNGEEKLLLSIRAENFSNSQVWIFPVPAPPDKVIINRIDFVPEIKGNELSAKAKEIMSVGELLSAASQIYPLPLLPLVLKTKEPVDIYKAGKLIAPLNTEVRYGPKDLTVYDHNEQNGMTTELLTAKTTKGLSDYFSRKGLKYDQNQIQVLEQYLGKDYTLVASWINGSPVLGADVSFSQEITYPPTITPTVLTTVTPTITPAISITITPTTTPGISIPAISTTVTPIISNFPETGDTPIVTPSITPSVIPTIIPTPVVPTSYVQRGMLVTFPTERIFYPLLPTSVYDNAIIPAEIYILGLVNPIIYQDIKDFATVDYFTDGYINYAQKAFIDSSTIANGSLEFTKISISAPSKLLTQDLWMNISPPIKPIIDNLVIKFPLVFIISGLVINSFLASMLGTLLIFKKTNYKQFWRYGLLGLTNLLSFGVFLLVLFLLPVACIKFKNQKLLDQLKDKGYYPFSPKILDRRKLIFIPLFSIFFLIFTFLGAEILKAIL